MMTMMMVVMMLVAMIIIIILLYFLVLDSQINDIYPCTKGTLMHSSCNDLRTFYLGNLPSD